MQVQTELIELLSDTRAWATNVQNVNTVDIYSSWVSQDELLAQLDQHIVDARQGVADFLQLRTLYAPTAGLCEIATHQGSAGYLKLAARFDAWFASVRPA
ncbi:MAG: hypothetical protein GC155_09755 [Alphaproteobacteria bacterium]|nr:hypothetical protein [Alphaproteobacteria bacterium]